MHIDYIKWLMFDMGSTLIDESLSFQGWFANASKLTCGGLSAGDIAREYCAGMARYSPTVSGQLVSYGFPGNNTHLYPSELDRPYDTAGKVLALLSQRYKLGIIANQNPGAVFRLEQYGLRKYFEVVVTSDEAGIKKPDPRIYRLALEQANCPPAQAVMIGDRLDNDIFPAKQLGMRTIRIRQGFSSIQEPLSEEYQADVTVESLEELLAVFDME
jgi:HAD superfamily hydrolase (TIGR01509 family)